MEDLRAHPESLGERGSAGGDDHELLEVDRVVGVRAAVQDVHHRHRHDRGWAGARDAGDVLVEGLLGVSGRRPGGGKGDAQDRVRAQARLVRGAVEVDHRLVDGSLIRGVGAVERIGDLAVGVRHRSRDALAQPLGAAVAQLGGLEFAGGGAGGDGGTAHRATGEGDVHLDRGIAPGVEDLPRLDAFDLGHAKRRPAAHCRAAGTG